MPLYGHNAPIIIKDKGTAQGTTQQIITHFVL